MVSSPSSRLRFLSLKGDELVGPPEWRDAYVEIVDAPEDLESIGLTRNGEPLAVTRRKLGDSLRTVAEWPVAGTGGYSLELREGGAQVEAASFSVTSEKLSPGSYEQLIDDLQWRLPVDIALSAQRAGALAGLNIIPPQDVTLASEMDRLRRACEGTTKRAGLTAVIGSLALRPHSILSSDEHWTRRERARRVNPSSLRKAFYAPNNLDENQVPLKVPELRVEHSVDVYENRLLNAFHKQVDARLRRVVNSSNSENQALRAEATTLLWALSAARREAAFLDEVSELTEPPSRLTMVLLKRSEYRSALEGFIEFRRSAVVRLDEPLLQAPLESLPVLYELWGTLQVISALQRVAESRGYRVVSEELFRQDAGQLWLRVLSAGRPALTMECPLSGRVLKLIPQRNYSAGSSTSAEYSVSFAKRPDVVVEVTEPSGDKAIWVFDPKYKLRGSSTGEGGVSENHSEANGPDDLAKPKQVDIDAMHAYRDAIRGVDGERLVRYAAILFPGTSQTYGHGLGALHADPTDEAELRGQLDRELGRCIEHSATPGPLAT
jgi:predicted component of viral defense system (DUF524 family)